MSVVAPQSLVLLPLHSACLSPNTAYDAQRIAAATHGQSDLLEAAMGAPIGLYYD